MKLTKIFKTLIHFLFLGEFLYAFVNYITTPKMTDIVTRRLWAYECWISFTMYGIFLWLFLYTEKYEPIDLKEKFLVKNKRIVAMAGVTILFGFTIAFTAISKWI